MELCGDDSVLRMLPYGDAVNAPPIVVTAAAN